MEFDYIIGSGVWLPGLLKFDYKIDGGSLQGCLITKLFDYKVVWLQSWSSLITKLVVEFDNKVGGVLLQGFLLHG